MSSHMTDDNRPDPGSRTEAAMEELHRRVEAMFDRMQTPEFTEAVLTILDQPLRVPVPQHLTGPSDFSQDE